MVWDILIIISLVLGICGLILGIENIKMIQTQNDLLEKLVQDHRSKKRSKRSAGNSKSEK